MQQKNDVNKHIKTPNKQTKKSHRHHRNINSEIYIREFTNSHTWTAVLTVTP